MNKKYRLSEILFILAGFLLIWAPSTAFAHDNLGDDELATAGWMLIAAIVVALMGALTLLWAARSGQFNNIEESKFRMIELADDYDSVMAQADDQEQAGQRGPQGGSKVPADSVDAKPKPTAKAGQAAQI